MNKVITFSELSIALDCLRKYKHIVIDKLDSGLDTIADIKFGSAMHLGINAYLQGEDGTEAFNIFWKVMQGKDLSYGRYDWQTLSQLGQDFLRKFSKRYLPDLKPLHMEKRLAGNWKGVDFEGTPDFIGTYKDELVLLDWKTTGSPYDKNKALTSMQLMLYSYLMKGNYGVFPKKIGFFPFVKSSGSIQNPVMQEFSEGAMTEMLSDIRSYVDKFESTKEYPRNPNKCIGCNFIERCWK